MSPTTKHTHTHTHIHTYTHTYVYIYIYTYIHIQIYIYMFLPDDLPLWGFIGDVVTNLVDGRNVTSYHLFTHYIFTMTQNGEGQVVNISNTCDMTYWHTGKQRHYLFLCDMTHSHTGNPISEK